MNLYLDDDSAKASLANLLRKAGHQVTVPADAGISGVSDPRHMIYCVVQNQVLITRNHDDFEDLHLLVQATGGRHPGLLGSVLKLNKGIVTVHWHCKKTQEIMTVSCLSLPVWSF
jgi:hypothetical protein